MSEQIELLRNDADEQYELHLDGKRVGLATFLRRGEVVVLPHTETDPAYQGRGLAGRLVAFALDDIRAGGLRVAPACPYVAEFIERHPEYADLLAHGS
jgi:predicted GNAT family acetyltransferase